MRATKVAVAVLAAGLTFTALGSPALADDPNPTPDCVPNPVTHECLPDPEDLVPWDTIWETVEDAVGAAEGAAAFVLGLTDGADSGDCDSLPNPQPRLFCRFLVERKECYVSEGPFVCHGFGDPVPDPLPDPVGDCLERATPAACAIPNCVWTGGSAQCVPVGSPFDNPPVSWALGSLLGGAVVADTSTVATVRAVLDDVLVTVPGLPPETVIGVGTGDPCQPWLLIPDATCAPNALVEPIALHLDAVQDHVCLFSAQLRLDYNMDGTADHTAPAVIPSPCPSGG